MLNTSTRRQRRGAAAVEFALTFPLLVLLAMGIIEYGWMFHQYNTVHTALRDGARAASKVDSSLVVATATARVTANLTHYQLCSASNCASAQLLNSPVDTFRITAAVPYQPVTGFAVPGVPSTMNAEITFAIQP